MRTANPAQHGNPSESFDALYIIKMETLDKTDNKSGVSLLVPDAPILRMSNITLVVLGPTPKLKPKRFEKRYLLATLR